MSALDALIQEAEHDAETADMDSHTRTRYIRLVLATGKLRNALERIAENETTSDGALHEQLIAEEALRMEP